jgi:hypothetical protein
MAEVTLSTVVDLDLVKMKWRETYVSEGLNRKVVPSQPAGIYQGLKIIQNIASPRRVEISPDAETNYHIAVYQTSDGYSLTYWDMAGTSIILDLSDASLDNEETIIAMEMDYQIGVDTTADWKAFPVADYNALPAGRKGELVVLGTVNVPAPATNITTGMITMERRTMSWRNVSKGVLPWSPIVRNGDFEQSSPNDVDPKIWWWDVTNTPGTGTGTVITQETDPYRNLMSLEFASLTTGNVTLLLRQNIRVPVTPGQLIEVSYQRKVITVLPGPNVPEIKLLFLESAGTFQAQTTIPVDVSGVDASYEKVNVVFEVPSGASTLADVTLGGLIDFDAAPLVGLYIDDLQVFLETSGERSDPQHGVSGDLEVAGNLVMRDVDNSHAQDPLKIIYDSSPKELKIDDHGSSGTVNLNHRGPLEAGDITARGDLDSVGSTTVGTTLDVTETSDLADQVTLGEALNNDDAGSSTPNIIHKVTPNATSPRTVIMEGRDGGNNRVQHLINSFASTWSVIQNARYDAATISFIKDINNVEAMAYEFTRSRIVIKHRKTSENANDDSTGFLESGWNNTMQLRWVEATQRPEIELYNGGVIQWPSDPSYPTGTAYEKNVLYAKSVIKAYGSIKTGFGPFMVGGTPNTHNWASLTQSGNRQVVTFDVAMDDDDYIVACNGYSVISSLFPYKYTTKIEFEAYNPFDPVGVVINLTTSSHVVDYAVWGNQI